MTPQALTSQKGFISEATFHSLVSMFNHAWFRNPTFFLYSNNFISESYKNYLMINKSQSWQNKIRKEHNKKTIELNVDGSFPSDQNYTHT